MNRQAHPTLFRGHVLGREQARGTQPGDDSSLMKKDGQLKLIWWEILTPDEASTWDISMSGNRSWAEWRLKNHDVDVTVRPKDTTKLSNPKDAVGVRKARWFSYIPLRVLVGVGLALLEGARKYGRHNYRIAGVRASVYVDAVVCGHLTPWMEGQDIDPDSGENHIDKAIASLMVLRDGMLEGNWEDDRPPAMQNIDEFFADANKRAVSIIERYPDAKAAYTQKDRVTPDQLIGAKS